MSLNSRRQHISHAISHFFLISGGIFIYFSCVSLFTPEKMIAVETISTSPTPQKADWPDGDDDDDVTSLWCFFM